MPKPTSTTRPYNMTRKGSDVTVRGKGTPPTKSGPSITDRGSAKANKRAITRKAKRSKR